MKVIKIGTGKTEGVVLLFVDSPANVRFGDVSESEPNFCFGPNLVEENGLANLVAYVEAGKAVCGFNDKEIAETRAFPDYVEVAVGDER